MEKIAKLIAILIVLSIFSSCDKDKKAVQNSSSSTSNIKPSANNQYLNQSRTTGCTTTSIEDSLKGAPHTKLIVRFTWSGSNGKGGDSPNCVGGDCGKCIGFCFKWVKRVEQPTNPFRTKPDYNNSENYIDIYLQNDSTLLAVPYQYIDNGMSNNGAQSGASGTVNIREMVLLPGLTSTQLGIKECVLKSGIYSINYNCNIPYGTFEIPVKITR